MRRTATILFHARQQAHFWHLNAPKYSEHKALEHFYTEILELTDKLIEVYIGKGRKIEFGQIRMSFHDYDRDKMMAYFKKLSNYINRTKRTLRSTDGDLNNVLEEILALVNQTIYLLNLK